MPDNDDGVKATALSVNQVAARWGVGRSRVHALIKSGRLPAIRLPAAGRYAEALRVPVSAVLVFEAENTLLPIRESLRPPPVRVRKFKHLRLPAEQCL